MRRKGRLRTRDRGGKRSVGCRWNVFGIPPICLWFTDGRNVFEMEVERRLNVCVMFAMEIRKTCYRSDFNGFKAHWTGRQDQIKISF